ncbi:MAG: 1-deoxy-D-xylulose-5-phosphate reductoisomerase [Puniceicoccales bacterium]|jgi:1-deoxy-D-xylulose-5-phosphate reductoisomerase|nr:1-deoxy-D-xylulose-5-phosphate reductoisomerase [Puniceicoccales bacterium]
MGERRKIVLLGATGSVGASVLRVLRREKENFELVGVSFHCNVVAASDIIREFSVPYFATEQLDAIHQPIEGQWVSLEELAALECADCVVIAVPGLAALRPLLGAIGAGKTIALANKESLVAAGNLIRNALKNSSAMILPLDSEHNGIFQCLGNRVDRTFSPIEELKKIWLTASGGPFRDLSADEMSRVSIADALRHPTWSMGAKISVDSATLANKGLEEIEASVLFDAPPNKISVLVHRESIVHGLVEFCDGSILAQLSPPSMEFPVAHCLHFPRRITQATLALDLAAIGQLHFEPPDRQRFPCLALAEDALRRGLSAPCEFDGANAAAVEAFLLGKIAFRQIPDIISRTLENLKPVPLDSVDAVEERHAEAYRQTKNKIF